MSAVYTVRCNVRDCVEIFNPIAEDASRWSLESTRAAARARGWSTVARGGAVLDLCPPHKHEKPEKP